MDERRDPGEFYPGGRVMVRPDVAPPQMQVRWSDIQGKPDLSDVAELGEEATRGEMKQTMNTVINKLKTTLLIGALFVVGSSLADPEPLFAKADDIPGNQQIMTNVQEYVDAKVAGVPAPGNYAAVSNAAMNAVQSQSMTNYATRAELDAGWWSEWTILRNGSNVTAQVEKPEWVPALSLWDFQYTILEDDAYYFIIKSIKGSEDDTDLTINATIPPPEPITYTATRHRVAAPVPTKPEDIGAASTNDLKGIRVQLDEATRTNAAQQAALSTHASQLSQQSQSISTLGSQVSAIGAHLNAENARFVSTNYNSATHMPEAYVEFKIMENGVSSWLTVWREMTRWNWFLGIYAGDIDALWAALANKGEREYAFYDGVTGEPAPDGFFWIAQPRVAIAAGMSYQRYVDTGGAVWVLESNGMVADVNGTTNGFFRISDDEGNTQFEIVKGSSRTVVAAPGAMTHESVMGVTHWFTTYAVTNAVSAPVAMFCRGLGSQEWHAETDGDCPCNVSWTNPEAGVYVCEWWAKGTEPRMFMRAKYGQGTESRIVQSAPVEMQYIVINGVKYTLGTATISGSTVLTLTPVSP